MGLSFRKSIKIGGMKLNLSKSGIGASVGVKGARIGLSSSGKAYVSGGANGIYYRKNIGSGTAVNNNSTPASTQSVDLIQAKDANYIVPIMLLFLSIISFLPALLFNYVFIFTAGTFLASIVMIISIKHKQELITVFTTKIQDILEAWKKEEFIPFIEELNNADLYPDNKQLLLKVFYVTYTMSAIIKNDYDETVVNTVYSKIENINKQELYEYIIDKIEASIEEATAIEFYNIYKYACEIIPSDKAFSLANEYKQILDLGKLELSEIKVDFDIGKGKCYYKVDFELMKQRVKDGQPYIEFDTEGFLYICDNQIIIDADGIKKIKLKDIASMHIENGLIYITATTRKTPYVLGVNMPNYVLALLNKLKTE